MHGNYNGNNWSSIRSTFFVLSHQYFISFRSELVYFLFNQLKHSKKILITIFTKVATEPRVPIG